MIGSSRMRWLGASAALVALVAIPAGARAASGGPGSNGPDRSPIALDDAGGSSGAGGGSSSSGACIAWAPGSSGGTGSGGAGSSSGSGAGSSSGSGAGNSSGSGGNLPADVQPPSAPGSVVVSAVTSSSAKVAWTASTDDVGVFAYWIHARPAGGPEVLFAAGVDGCTHEATVTGLTPQTTYGFSVEAEDLGGHRTRSAPAPATTADPPPFSLSVEPRSVAVTCGTPASATVRVVAAPGFTGTVQLAADFPMLQVVFSPAATASTSTVTFSCDPFPGGGGGPITITGSSDPGVASTELSLFFNGNLDPGGDPGGSSSSSSGGNVDPGGSSSGGGSSGGSGGWSSSGGNVDPGGNSGGSSGGYVGPGGSSSGGGSSGGSGGWSSSGGSSGGSSSGAIGGSSRTGADSGSGAPQTGCTSAGGADAGSLALALLLWAARAPRRRGATRSAA